MPLVWCVHWQYVRVLSLEPLVLLVPLYVRLQGALAERLPLMALLAPRVPPSLRCVRWQGVLAPLALAPLACGPLHVLRALLVLAPSAPIPPPRS